MIYPHNISELQRKAYERDNPSPTRKPEPRKDPVIVPGSDMERFKKSVARHVRQMKVDEKRATQKALKNIPHVDLAKPPRDYFMLWAILTFIIFGGWMAGLVWFIISATWNLTPVAP